MENFIFYLGRASVLLAIFFLPYYFFLRKETFFNSNRWFLLIGILASLALPFFVFTKIIFVEQVIDNFQIPISSAEIIATKKPNFQINWLHIVLGIYSLGVAFFFGRFIRDVIALLKIIRIKNSSRSEGFKLINTNKIKSPFSFFNYIFFNSELFTEKELENILAHEKVHSSEYHSVDMIFSQLLCIFIWFNPFSWLHQKSIAQNLEFIADAKALEQVSDKIMYQKTLLKVSAPQMCIPITNHFYQSLIKKRIVMLNKNQSKRRNSWKYATVFPLITIFMLQFQVETVAQLKEKNATAVDTKSNVTIKEPSGYSFEMVASEVPVVEKQSLENPAVQYRKKARTETAEIQNEKDNQVSGYSMSFETSTPEESLRKPLENPNLDHDKALILIDNKESNLKEYNAIVPEDLRSISVVSKMAVEKNKKWTDQYGEKAKHGIIIVQTSKTMKSITLANNDEVLFFDGNKCKVPGHPSINLYSPENTFFINGKKVSGETVKNLDKMKTIEVIEDFANKSGERTIKITI